MYGLDQVSNFRGDPSGSRSAHPVDAAAFFRCEPRGGTDFGAGLQRLREAVRLSMPRADRYVFFMTDGPSPGPANPPGPAKPWTPPPTR